MFVEAQPESFYHIEVKKQMLSPVYTMLHISKHVSSTVTLRINTTIIHIVKRFFRFSYSRRGHCRELEDKSLLHLANFLRQG